MQVEEVKHLIESGLPNAEVFVEGDGTHFNALVISSLFEGQNRLKKQQMVYDTVKKELMNGTLHALSLKTFTPEEWEVIRNQNQNGS